MADLFARLPTKQNPNPLGLGVFQSIITSTGAWQPLMVMFLIVQQIEGNFITPKVVGSSVKINPLAALLAMFVGWSLWGVSGVIMALPFIAIFKVICDNITFLHPIGKLLSSDIHYHEKIFFQKYRGQEYSWSTVFKKVEVLVDPKEMKEK